MNSLQDFFGTVDFWQVISSFIFLIAIIDPFGNIPITIAMQNKGVKIIPWRVCLASLIILYAFLFAACRLSFSLLPVDLLSF